MSIKKSVFLLRIILDNGVVMWYNYSVLREVKGFDSLVRKGEYHGKD
jgi:hypothetical protein